MKTKSLGSMLKNAAMISMTLILIFSNTPVIAQQATTASTTNNPANQDIPSDWLAKAQEHIQQSEYRVTWVDQPLIPGAPASFQAPNRAQNLRFYFQPDGLQVIRREEEQPSWVWGLSLAGYGRQGTLNSLDTPGLTAEDEQVTYRYSDIELTFDNSTMGLGQEIKLLSPTGERSSGELTVRLELSGDFSLHRLPDGDLQFQFGDEPMLDYSLLYATDAAGHPLAARVDTGQDGWNLPEETGVQVETYLELAIDDSQAQYPLQVSLLLSGLDPDYDWYDRGGLPLAHLGTSVATAGDVNGDGYSDVIIGAPDFDLGQLHRGEVLAYYGSPSGPPWDNPDWLKAGGTEGTLMGASVSTAGDVNGDGFSDVIVGAPGEDNDPYADSGKVYVYHGSDTGLSTTPAWTLQINQESIYLGTSVATAGDLNGDGYSDVVVGAPWYDDVSTDSGIIFVQYGGPFGLPGGYAWYYTGVFEGDRYGYSVATAGDINADGYADLLVGAPYYGTNEAHDNQAGRVHLFLGNSSKTAPTNAYKSFYGKNGGDHFGWSVSTAGDVNGDGYADLIIGAPRADIHTESVTAEGEAYVFYGFPEMDTVVDWYTRGDDEQGKLGYSVATAGDVNADGYGDVIIGQPYFDDSEFAPDEGRAMIFLGGMNGIGGAFTTPANADWVADGNADGALFGFSVTTAGDVNGDGWSDVLVGAPNYGISGSEDEGWAYLFYGGWLNPSDTADWTYTLDSSPEGPDKRFGWSVASAGDVNGDGFADVIIGAPSYDSTYTNEGAAFVFFGEVGGLGWDPDWYALGSQASAFFGWSVNSAGDINGDGYSDIIIGAPYLDNTQQDEGMAFVWLGSSGGLGSVSTYPILQADWYAQSNWATSYLGASVASAGDVNGDGYSDIVVGAPYCDRYGAVEAGHVLVWYGSASGLGENGTLDNTDWRSIGNYANGRLGTSVSSAGDVNRDGYSDVIAGGVAFAKAWYGSQQGPHQVTQDWIIWGPDYGQVNSVNGAGDINGDGYSDIVFGAPYKSVNLYEEGAVYAYCGSASGLPGYGSAAPSYACWYDYGNDDYAHLGYSVNTAGDVNGDGYADIIAGAPDWSNPTANEGQARLYYGASGGPILISHGDWKVEGNAVANLGGAVASAGDVNGDAYADLIIGGSSFDSNGGKADLYFGNGGQGKPYLLKQRQNDSSNLHNLGGVRPHKHFYMNVTASSPFGYSLVKTKQEIKPLGTVFNGGGTTENASWYWAGPLDASINTSGLNTDTGVSYHWRLRLRYNLVTNPFAPPYGRWMHIPWSGWNEADVRRPSFTIFLSVVLR